MQVCLDVMFSKSVLRCVGKGSVMELPYCYAIRVCFALMGGFERNGAVKGRPHSRASSTCYLRVNTARRVQFI